MVVVLKHGVAKESRDQLISWLKNLGLNIHAGWHYWFSQRFLRNKRGLQELELNWLAVHYDDDGLVDKTFSSQVTNL